MKNTKDLHSQECLDVQSGFSKGEGYVCINSDQDYCKEPQHAPTTWKAVKAFQNNGPDYWIVTDKAFRGNLLARCDFQDDAEKVSRAVNAYEKDQEIKRKLVDCLKDALEVIGSWGTDGEPGWATRAKEVIAEAK